MGFEGKRRRLRSPRDMAARLGQRLQALKPRNDEDRNITYVALDGLAVGLATAAANFLSVFIVRLGADALWVSLLSSLPALIKLVLTLPLSRFVERRARVINVFAWTRLLGRTSYLIFGLLPFFLPHIDAARMVVLVWTAVAIPMGMQQLAFSLAMNRAVRRERRAVLMSTRWSVMGISKVALLFVVSYLLQAIVFPLNYQVLFFISFAASILAFGIIKRVRVPDQAEARPRPVHMGRAPRLKRLMEGLSEIVKQRSFVLFTTARNVYWLGISMVAPLIPIYYVDVLDASDAWVGYFSTALTITSLVGYTLWVRLKRRRGNRFVLLTSVLGRSIHPLLVSLTGSPLAMLFVSAFNGISFSGMNLMFFDAFMDTLPRGKEARFLAINQTLTNLIGFVAPPIGAWVYSLFGIRAALLAGSVVAFAGFGVFFFGGVARPVRKPAAFPEAA